MESLMMDRQLLLSSLLWRTERLFHDKRIITRLADGGYHSYTYREYGQRVRKLCNALGRLGVGHGTRVGSLGWNHYRHLETYFAVPGIGAVLHTVNLRLFPEQQRFTINKVDDRGAVPRPRPAAGGRGAGRARHPDGHDVRRVRRHRAGDPPGERARLRGPDRRRVRRVRVPGVRRARRRRDLLHLGHHRRPEGRRLQPPRDGAAGDVPGHARQARHERGPGLARGRADVPLQRLEHPAHRAAAGRDAGPARRAPAADRLRPDGRRT